MPPNPTTLSAMQLKTLAAAFVAASLQSTALAADKPVVDLPGAADHPLIKRFAGSWLAGQSVSNWDAAVLPASAEMAKGDDRQFKDPLNLEGRVTRTLYIAPRGKAALEVWRNYEQALNAAGFKKRFRARASAPTFTSPGGRRASPTRA